MRMMGMLDSAYHTSWFIFFFFQMLFVTVLITIMSIWVFPNSNFVLIFLFYFLYGLSLFGYMMIFIAIFKEVKTGTPIFMILHLILYYIRWAMPEGTPFFVRVLTCFIPNLAINNFALVLWSFEEQKLGVNFTNINQLTYNFNASTYFIIQFCNIFIYLAIGLYLTYTLPTEFGSQLPPFFCF